MKTFNTGKLYRTPWTPNGLVRVIAYEYDKFRPTVQVRFVGDHPMGYKDGTIGRYFADELTEVPPPPTNERINE